MATILIVEDEEDLRLLMRMLLRNEPHQILEAATGAEAAELWPRADLVLLDIRLPDIDGLDLLRGRDNQSTPVIALSAHSAGDLRAAALEAGCVDYLTKPVASSELLDAIREHLHATS